MPLLAPLGRACFEARSQDRCSPASLTRSRGGDRGANLRLRHQLPAHAPGVRTPTASAPARRLAVRSRMLLGRRGPGTPPLA